jgi:hypothetical protein
MKRKFMHLGLASSIVGLALTGGLAMASSASIDTTGPDSLNRITINDSSGRVSLSNHNTLRLINRNWQWARTGNARVFHNTIGGDAVSGDATNDNSTDTSVSIDNGSFDLGDFGLGSGNFDGSIDTTGPDSVNVIRFEGNNSFSQTNRNNLTVDNSNRQNARSGNATVSDNTEGGDASTGSAANSNDTSTSVDVSNSSPSFSGSGSGDNSATINLTGPDSRNTISISQSGRVTVRNTNNVDVTNSNNQSASSGNATVNHNTIGGSASSGDAMNSNSTSSDVTISN